MNENLTNYLKFLENSKKFKEMDKAGKAQMLSDINAIIEADSIYSYKNVIFRVFRG